MGVNSSRTGATSLSNDDGEYIQRYVYMYAHSIHVCLLFIFVRQIFIYLYLCQICVCAHERGTSKNRKKEEKPEQRAMRKEKLRFN